MVLVFGADLLEDLCLVLGDKLSVNISLLVYWLERLSPRYFFPLADKGPLSWLSFHLGHRSGVPVAYVASAWTSVSCDL